MGSTHIPVSANSNPSLAGTQMPPGQLQFWNAPGTTVAAATTIFAGLGAAGFSTPENTRQLPVPNFYSVSRLRLVTSTAQPAGQNFTVRVRRNGVSVLQLVIVASAPAGVYEATVSPPVIFAPGDLFSLQAVQDAGASASASVAQWQVGGQ